MRNPQDHGERKKWHCATDGAQDSGLGDAFGEPLTSEGEARSAEHRKENSYNGREDSPLPFDHSDRLDQLLAVMLSRLNGDDRAMTTSSPGGNGGSRYRDVLGQASGTGPDHLVPKAVVVRAACPGRGRGGV
jgi:hypothetical protein